MLNISPLFNRTTASRNTEESQASIELIAYRREHDGPSSIENRLSQIFRRIAREGLLQTGLFDSPIRTTGDFINFMHSDREIFLVRHNGREAGLFWFERTPEASATGRFCLYREFSGAIAAAIHTHCMEKVAAMTNRKGAPLYASVRLMVPAAQKETLSALRKTGMKKVGRIAGMGMDYKANETIDGILLSKDNRPRGTSGWTLLPLPQVAWRLVASSFSVVLLSWW